MTKTETMESLLKGVYPRALSYAELFHPILNGVKAVNRANTHSGTPLRTLVKQGKAKRITDGFYCWIPQ